MPHVNTLTPGQLAQARSHSYALFGQLLLHGLTPQLMDYVSEIPALTAVVPQPYDADEAAAAHYRLFGFHLFPYESFFMDASGLLGGDVAEDVAATYARLGYEPSLSSTDTDHIGNELGAMSFLAGAEADAWVDGLAQTAVQMQRHQGQFMQRHLLRWLPPLVVAIQQHDDRFFAELAQLTLLLVADHYAALQPETAVAMPLPAPPNLLADDKTSLRDVADYLATPLHSGLLLGRFGVGQLAQRLELPRGFGSRDQLLLNLMRAAVQYEGFGKLGGLLAETAVAWQQAYAQIASDFPALAPFVQPWLAQVAHTSVLLTHMQQQVQLLDDSEA